VEKIVLLAVESALDFGTFPPVTRTPNAKILPHGMGAWLRGFWRGSLLAAVEVAIIA
jgi:hypothetical protein